HSGDGGRFAAHAVRSRAPSRRAPRGATGSALHGGRMGEAAGERLDPPAMAARLAAFVAAEEGLAERAVRADGLRRLAGGASREIWSVDLAIERAPGVVETLPLVLRKDPPG